MHHHTEGAEALTRWLDLPGHSQAALATELEVSQPAVSAWARGVSRPEPHLRAALQLLTQIPPAAWDKVEERELVARVRARVKRASEPRRRALRDHKPTGTEG